MTKATKLVTGLETVRLALFADPPVRADLEKAHVDATAEAARAQAAVDSLQEARDNLLISPVGDDVLEKHDSEARREARAKDRASALAASIERRLSELDVAEHRQAVEAKRREAEKAANAAVEALRMYPETAAAIRAIMIKLESANALAELFHRDHPDEPHILNVEASVRFVPALDEKVVSSEIIRVWCYVDNGKPIGDTQAARVTVVERPDLVVRAGHFQHDMAKIEVIELPFRREAYLSRESALTATSLLEAIQLPPLLAGKHPERQPATRLVPVDPANVEAPLSNPFAWKERLYAA